MSAIVSRLSQHQIDNPTTADVRNRSPATMAKNLLLPTACFFQRIRQHGHRGEIAGVVHRLGERHGCRCLPGRIESDGTEGVAEDVSEDLSLSLAVEELRESNDFRVFIRCNDTFEATEQIATCPISSIVKVNPGGIANQAFGPSKMIFCRRTIDVSNNQIESLIEAHRCLQFVRVFFEKGDEGQPSLAI